MIAPTAPAVTGPPPRSVLAVGAWLKNAAGLLRRDDAGRLHWTPSPLHGDLGTPAACAALEASVDALLAAAGAPVDAVAHDLHPDFHSTRLALALADRLAVPAVAVQHHHAHLAVPMAEAALDGGSAPRAHVRNGADAVGLALDGVGLGSDGAAWGGELLALHGAGFRRLAHLAPLALPGGDRAAREPWRMAAAALHAMGDADAIVPRFAPVVGEPLARGVRDLLDRRLQCPEATGAGRWFDAAAGLLGLHPRQQHEAQAAIALERLAAEAGDLDAALAGEPRRTLVRPARAAGDPAVIDPTGTFARMRVWADAADTADAAGGMEARVRAAALFHRDLADALADAAADAARRAGLAEVLLGGGCLHNRVLRERLVRRLATAGLVARRPARTDPGDAGLALGQAWVALRALDLNASPSLPSRPAAPATATGADVAPTPAADRPSCADRPRPLPAEPAPCA